VAASDYLLQAADVPPGVTVPAAGVANVIPLVDGKNYFGALYTLLTDLLIEPEPKQLPDGSIQRSFVFLSAWVMNDYLPLPDPRIAGQPDTLIELLVSLAEHDVDVWVILWLDPALVPQLWSPPPFQRWLTSAIQWLTKPKPRPGRQPMKTENVGIAQNRIVRRNLRAAFDLRQYKALQNRVVLDYTADPAAAHHMKVAVVYNAQENTLDGFCGGMDPSPDRAGDIGHSESFAGHPGSPLNPAGYPVSAPPVAPTLAQGGPGNIPAGDYDVRYTVTAETADGPVLGLISPWATIRGVPAASNIVVSGMASLPAVDDGPIPPQECAVFARPAGTVGLPRLAGSTETPGDAITLSDDPSKWGSELIFWEWHDTAVQVQGPAALPIAQTLGDRWNDVIGGPSFSIDTRSADPSYFPYTRWHGSVNEAPAQILKPPSVSAVPGTLPAGTYEICLAVTAKYQGHTLYLVSDTAAVTLSGTQGMQVSALGAPPAGFTYNTIDIYASAGPGTKTMLAGTTNDPTQAVTILTGPSQWTGDLAAPFQPQPISSFSSLQPTPPTVANQTVQMLRTFAKISSVGQRIAAAPRQYSFAPNGEFTVYYGYRKAIAQAQQYVYIEDQCMFSSVLMDMLAQQVNKYPNLKVLLVTSGISDPNDQGAEWGEAHFWNSCIYDGLVKKAPTSGNVKFFRSRGLTVHSKLLIIDDVWAAVGSANAINHSLAVDSEMQISIYDSSGAPPLPAALRKTLWAEHLNISTSDAAYDDLGDIAKALAMWWSPQTSSIPQPHLYRAEEIKLPVDSPPFKVGEALMDILGETTVPPKDSPWPPF
jgi:phosphatidylserine/phosphatidylglycerophosphate/cardiolipin synthase-like enzyme